MVTKCQPQAAACDVWQRLHACGLQVQGNVWTYNELCKANQVFLRYPESEEDDAFAWRGSGHFRRGKRTRTFTPLPANLGLIRRLIPHGGTG